MMKKLLIGAALASAIAAPAAAQSFSPDVGTGNIVRNPSVRYSGAIMPNSFRDAYAYQKPGKRDRHYKSPVWRHTRW